MSGGMGAMFGGSQPTVSAIPLTPDSPTMMNVDQNPDDVSLANTYSGLVHKRKTTYGGAP